ncbi:MAG: hypothetical protein ACRC92_21825 [Peptostreptococcaceae bacterium]
MLEADKCCGTCEYCWGDGDYYCFKDGTQGKLVYGSDKPCEFWLEVRD